VLDAPRARYWCCVTAMCVFATRHGAGRSVQRAAQGNTQPHACVCSLPEYAIMLHNAAWLVSSSTLPHLHHVIMLDVHDSVGVRRVSKQLHH